MSVQGREGVFGSAVGPPHSGQRAADENRPTRAQSAIPISSIGRVVCDADMRAPSHQDRGTLTRCDEVARLLIACSAPGGADAPGCVTGLRQTLSTAPAASDARDAVQVACLPLPAASRRRSCMRGISDKCLIFAGSKNREGVRFYEPNPLICLEFLAPRPGLEPGTYGLTAPPPNGPETRANARFPGFCCLIFLPSS